MSDDLSDPALLSWWDLFREVYPFDVEGVAKALSGSVSMPTEALLHGAPPARCDLRHDFFLWHHEREHDDAEYREAGNGIIRDAGQHPSATMFRAVRLALRDGAGPADVDRIDYWSALFGDLDAARRLRVAHVDDEGVVPAFLRVLEGHARRLKSSGRKDVEFQPSLGPQILAVACERHAGVVAVTANTMKRVAAWRLARNDAENDAIRDAVREVQDRVVRVAIDEAEIWLAGQDSAAAAQPEAAKADRAGMAFVRSLFDVWKKKRLAGEHPSDAETVAAAREVLDRIEKDEDRQISMDTDDVGIAWSLLIGELDLEAKAALAKEGDGSAASAKEELSALGGAFAKLDAAGTAAASEEAILEDVSPAHDEPTVDRPPPSMLVLGPLQAGKAKAGDNDMAALFAGIAGEPVPLVVCDELADVRARLVAAWPHCVELVDRMLGDLREGEPVRLRPTLLVGAPGSGKTSLAKALALMLCVPDTVYPCAAVADGSFGGTPAQWSTRRASVPLETIRRERIANPVIVLDELEKTGQSAQNGALVHALLPMLETHTARSYFETGLEAAADLSAVNFVATANDSAAIPAPLLDRFRVLRMPEARPGHAEALVPGVLADVVRERGLDRRWVPPLAPDEMAVVRRTWGGGSLRRLRRAVEATVDARDAALRGRSM